MATIDRYLEDIKNKTYGEDVRDAIHDGIQQCYTDATDVVKVSDTPPTSENTRIWIKPVNEDMSVPTWEEHEELADEVSDLKAAFRRGELSSCSRIRDGTITEIYTDGTKKVTTIARNVITEVHKLANDTVVKTVTTTINGNSLSVSYS